MNQDRGPVTQAFWELPPIIDAGGWLSSADRAGQLLTVDYVDFGVIKVPDSESCWCLYSDNVLRKSDLLYLIE